MNIIADGTVNVDILHFRAGYNPYMQTFHKFIRYNRGALWSVTITIDDDEEPFLNRVWVRWSESSWNTHFSKIYVSNKFLRRMS